MAVSGEVGADARIAITPKETDAREINGKYEESLLPNDAAGKLGLGLALKLGTALMRVKANAVNRAPA
jgi:hypothetical protein